MWLVPIRILLPLGLAALASASLDDDLEQTSSNSLGAQPLVIQVSPSSDVLATQALSTSGTDISEAGFQRSVEALATAARELARQATGVHSHHSQHGQTRATQFQEAAQETAHSGSPSTQATSAATTFTHADDEQPSSVESRHEAKSDPLWKNGASHEINSAQPSAAEASAYYQSRRRRSLPAALFRQWPAPEEHVLGPTHKMHPETVKLHGMRHAETRHARGGESLSSSSANGDAAHDMVAVQIGGEGEVGDVRGEDGVDSPAMRRDGAARSSTLRELSEIPGKDPFAPDDDKGGAHGVNSRLSLIHI